MRSIVFLFAVTLALYVPARAGDRPAADPVLAQATDLAGTAMFLNSGAPGMVLVLVHGGQSLVLGYGETEKGNNHARDGNSLFRLNSITKVFATEVLVSLAADGRLALTDRL
jgi:serine-type D-Ala-D-Ala carboxypeptidase/endopeptidase